MNSDRSKASSLPRISIIVPSLNQGHFISETLESILSQSHKPHEVIVVDGGSLDDTLEILKSYGDRIKWSSGPDSGQSNAINKGFTMVSGDVVSFLNSDDTFEPGALMTVATFFSEHANAVWVSGKCRMIDAKGTATRSFVENYKHFWARYFSANPRCLS